MKWEYIMVITLNGPSSSSIIRTGFDDLPAFMAKLNELGSIGWELVAVSEQSDQFSRYSSPRNS